MDFIQPEPEVDLLASRAAKGHRLGGLAIEFFAAIRAIEHDRFGFTLGGWFGWTSRATNGRIVWARFTVTGWIVVFLVVHDWGQEY